MKFDFESIIERKGKDAIAVDILPCNFGIDRELKVREGFDCIPMWVADMNFATAPAVVDAIRSRLEHPLFGYFFPQKEYTEKIINWQTEFNGAENLSKDNIGYENGVLGGVASVLHALCSQGDSILVHSPTYVGFTGVLKNNGYNIVHSPLEKDDNGVWRMNYADMEQKIVDNHIHVAIFCSPHNPCGRVWEREEIETAMELFKKHDVYVISDEIWSDIILYNNKHIPTQSVSEDARNRTIALYATTKTFNLAGLVGSYHIIYNKYLKERIDKEASLGHYNSMNIFSMYALMGAYSEEGREWVEELRQVIGENVSYAADFISEKFEGVEVFKPQGTYMMFLDCREFCQKNNISMDDLLMKGFEVGVFWQDGRNFNDPFSIRMNVALPKSKLVEAFDRLDKYVFNP